MDEDVFKVFLKTGARRVADLAYFKNIKESSYPVKEKPVSGKLVTGKLSMSEKPVKGSGLVMSEKPVKGSGLLMSEKLVKRSGLLMSESL